MFFKISLEQVGITFFDDKAVEDLCLDIIEKIERRTINHFLKNKNIAKKFNFEESTPKNKQLEQYIKTNYKVQENCTEIEKLAAYIQEYIQLKIETNDDLNDPNNQNITKPNQVKNDDNDQNDNASFANNKQNATLEKFNKQITQFLSLLFIKFKLITN